MKRSTVITILVSVCLLAFGVTDKAIAAAAPEPDTNCAALPVAAAYSKVAPVFDATGAVVSDPTGTLANARTPLCLSAALIGTDIRVAPVFDTAGNVMSDPAGILSNGYLAENMAIPVTNARAKVAPVFDASGTLVSDPTGTIWNGSNP